MKLIDAGHLLNKEISLDMLAAEKVVLVSSLRQRQILYHVTIFSPEMTWHEGILVLWSVPLSLRDLRFHSPFLAMHREGGIAFSWLR